MFVSHTEPSAPSDHALHGVQTEEEPRRMDFIRHGLEAFHAVWICALVWLVSRRAVVPSIGHFNATESAFCKIDDLFDVLFGDPPRHHVGSSPGWMFPKPDTISRKMRKPLLDFNVLRAILRLSGRQCGESHLCTKQSEFAVSPALEEHTAAIFFFGLDIGIDAVARRR